MIYAKSRYRRVQTLQVADSSGVYAQVYETRDTTVEPPTSARTYTVQDGDTFESIAAEHLGNPALWWVLADTNPDAAFCPSDLAAGTTIQLPSTTWAGLQA